MTIKKVNFFAGSDTVFNKRYYEQYDPVNPAFYGTGTDGFNYLTTSTFTILTGSDNAIFKLRVYTKLDVKLVYFNFLKTFIRYGRSK